MKYKLNTIYKGIVTKCVDYGGFVKLEEGLEGLVHQSELSWTKTNSSPSKSLCPSQEINVKIIEIDLERRRISLSVKQAAEGGVVAEEYQEHFGEQNYDTEGNYIGTAIELDPEAAAELDEAWSAYEQSEQARMMTPIEAEVAEELPE